MAAEPVRERDVDRAAAAWLVRLDGPGLDDAERRGFRAWHDADPAHAAAFERARHLWSGLGAAAAGLDRTTRQRRRRRVAVVVSLVLAAAIDGLLLRPGANLATPHAAIETVTLADGSRLTLDGDSAADIAMDPAARRVTLRRGRAFFEVEPDAGRPFVVVAGPVAAEVLGTAFMVDRHGGGVSILVERGRVAVSLAGERVELAAGERVEVDDHLGPPAPAALASALAWRRGLMVFEDRTLAEVAAELDRSTRARVVIPQASVRELVLSGIFRADDPDAILDAIRTGLGLGVARLGVATVIYR